MLRLRIPKWLYALAVGLAVYAFAPTVAFAVGDQPTAPKPKPKPKSKTKKKEKESALSPDEIYNLGYWQAKGGQYAEALATLSRGDQRDPRIATMIGFSLRKLGRVDAAMDYYLKVLAQHPERTNTRQYLGEAYLELGRVDKAKEQLAEIAKRCSTACEDYQLLADEIAKFEKSAG
jgi:tetratricopeptide (TPR) repeat protein